MGPLSTFNYINTQNLRPRARIKMHSECTDFGCLCCSSLLFNAMNPIKRIFSEICIIRAEISAKKYSLNKWAKQLIFPWIDWKFSLKSTNLLIYIGNISTLLTKPLSNIFCCINKYVGNTLHHIYLFLLFPLFTYRRKYQACRMITQGFLKHSFTKPQN